jgi:hypothetical protein
MDCLAQVFKVSRNLYSARVGQREIFKTWIFSQVLLVRMRYISLHDVKLILCMLGRLHKLQYEIRKPIPKGPKRVSNSVYLYNY